MCMEKRTFLNILNNWWKCFLMLLKPVPLAIGAPIFWYYLVYLNGIHFVEGGEILGIWISMFGVIYGLLAAIILTTVWNEYKAMGIAVKRFDLDSFIDLRDEEVSPLVHTLMIMLSIAILLAFMCIHYDTVYSGVTFIASTAYLFALIFYIVLEIDDPCDGIWYIKDIPEEWLKIDVKKFRQERFGKLTKTEKKEEKLV
jgi:hypothetical protein